MVFVIHWHESAMSIHVSPILNPPPTSLSKYYQYFNFNLLLNQLQKHKLKKIYYKLEILTNNFFHFPLKLFTGIHTWFWHSCNLSLPTNLSSALTFLIIWHVINMLAHFCIASELFWRLHIFKSCYTIFYPFPYVETFLLYLVSRLQMT